MIMIKFMIFKFMIFKEKSWIWFLLSNLFSKVSQGHLLGENLYWNRQLIPKD